MMPACCCQEKGCDTQSLRINEYPLMLNQIAGGKSLPASLEELAQLRTPAAFLADCSSLLEENLSRRDSEL